MSSNSRTVFYTAALASLALLAMITCYMLSAGPFEASRSVVNPAVRVIDLSQPEAKVLALQPKKGPVEVLEDSMCSRFRSESPFYGSPRVNVLREAHAQQSAFCRLDSHLNPDASASNKYAKASVKVRTATYSMWVYRDSDIVSKSILSNGQWDSRATEKILDALELARKFLERKLGTAVDPVFTDIGTNVGWHTAAMSSQGYSTISFEPMRPNEVALRRTLCANPNMMERVTYFNRGLSSKEQTCRFYARPQNIGNGLVKCGDGAPPAGTVLRDKTELVRLDDYATNYLCRRNEEASRSDNSTKTAAFAVVKMDVEGFEPLVLAGGQRFFREMEIPFVYMEYNPRELRSRDPSRNPIQLLLDMMELGYAISMENFGGPVLTEEQLMSSPAFMRELDVYCTHRSFNSS